MSRELKDKGKEEEHKVGWREENFNRRERAASSILRVGTREGPNCRRNSGQGQLYFIDVDLSDMNSGALIQTDSNAKYSGWEKNKLWSGQSANKKRIGMRVRWSHTQRGGPAMDSKSGI